MNTDYTQVLQRLKEERLSHGITQKDMGIQIGISQGHYSKAEQAVKRFTYSELKRLSESELDFYYIYTGRRIRQQYGQIFSHCSYRELLCYLNMIVSLAACLYDEQKLKCGERFYRQLRCIKFITNTDENAEETIFYLVRHLEKETQCSMADQLCVDTKRYRRLERGSSLPDSELIWILYERYGVPPAFVLNDKRGIACDIEYFLDKLRPCPNDTLYNYFCLLHHYYTASPEPQ